MERAKIGTTMWTTSARLNFLDQLIGPFRKGKGRLLRSKGSYHFLSLLGRGGMGEVWLAEKLGAKGFSKLVAIKTIRRHRLRDKRTLEMFFDEARLVANLIHPNIVQVFQLHKSRQEVSIIMEHVFGRTLLQLMERLKSLGQELPVDLGAFIIAKVAHGLYYAHKKHNRNGEPMNIVHRDICPSNILLSFRGIPKITDFGVAKADTSTVDDEGNIVWGKYPYMAPEAVSRRGTDPRSDIYALGLVLYEILTGHLAHDAGSTRALEVLLQEEKATDLDIRRYAPHLPEAIAAIVIKATQHSPDHRYQTAREMAQDIEQFLLSHFLLPDEERLSDFLASVFPQARKHRWW
jgi:serine/threonine protein kinase